MYLYNRQISIGVGRVTNFEGVDWLVEQFINSEDYDMKPIPDHLLPDLEKMMTGAAMKNCYYHELTDCTPFYASILLKHRHSYMIYVSMFQYYSGGRVDFMMLSAVMESIFKGDIKDSTWDRSIWDSQECEDYEDTTMMELLESHIGIFTNPLDQDFPIYIGDVKVQPEDEEEHTKMVSEYPLYMQDPNLVNWDIDPLTLWYILHPDSSSFQFIMNRNVTALPVLLEIRRLVKTITSTFMEAHPEYVFPPKKSAMSAVTSD